MAGNEIRRDPISGYWVILSERRAKRPHQFVREKVKRRDEKCPFCPGNEHMVMETDRIPEKGKWLVKAVRNKYPFVDELDEKTSLPREGVIKDEPFYYHFPSLGYHEVIIDTRSHNREVFEQGVLPTYRLLEMYKRRTGYMMRNRWIRCVSIFKNKGPQAGASLLHPHSQISSFPFIPERLRKEMGKGCKFCKYIEFEREGPRFVYENEKFIVLSPYAPRFAFEMWVLSKEHKRDILEMGKDELLSLSNLLVRLFRAMRKVLGDFPYNYAIHQAPKGRDFHFHLEIYPKLSIWAGLELGSGIYVNAVCPEDAALSLRDYL